MNECQVYLKSIFLIFFTLPLKFLFYSKDLSTNIKWKSYLYINYHFYTTLFICFRNFFSKLSLSLVDEDGLKNLELLERVFQVNYSIYYYFFLLVLYLFFFFLIGFLAFFHEINWWNEPIFFKMVYSSIITHTFEQYHHPFKKITKRTKGLWWTKFMFLSQIPCMNLITWSFSANEIYIYSMIFHIFILFSMNYCFQIVN